MVIKDEFGAILEEYGCEDFVGTPMHKALADRAWEFAVDMLASSSSNLREETEAWQSAYEKLYKATTIATNRSEQLVRENSRLAYDVRLLKAAVYIMIAVVVVMLIFLLSAGGNPW